MGIIERLKDFLNPKMYKPSTKDLTPENVDKIMDKTILGDDPYYQLWGINYTIKPDNYEYLKYWMYNRRIKKLSEWKKLGFTIREIESDQVGREQESISYSFGPLSKECAEDLIKQYGNILNFYEITKQEIDNKKITTESTSSEIQWQSERVIDSLGFALGWRDIKDIKDNYNWTIRTLKYLKDFEDCENYFEYSKIKEKPSLILEKLDDYETYLMKCIENEQQFTIEKVSKMKTKQGKINTLNRYLKKLIECKSGLTKAEYVQRYNLMLNEVKDLVNSL